MPIGLELRSMQKRMLYTLKKIEQENPGVDIRDYIKAVEVEMEEEDVALVEKKLK